LKTGFSSEEVNVTVQQDIAFLLQLQDLDLKTRDIRNELENIPRHIEEIRQNVETVRTILQKETDRLTEAESWHRRKEADIALQNDLMNKSRIKLQGARNEKESKAAQREIDTIKKNISDQEKELIELLEAIEHYRTAIAEHQKEFSELESHLEESRREGDTRMTQIRESLVSADAERKALTVQINPASLRFYERIYRRLVPAVVKTSEPTCAGCNFEIRPQVMLELMRGDTLITCQNCVRILVYDGEPAVPAEPTDSAVS